MAFSRHDKVILDIVILLLMGLQETGPFNAWMFPNIQRRFRLMLQLTKKGIKIKRGKVDVVRMIPTGTSLFL